MSSKDSVAETPSTRKGLTNKGLLPFVFVIVIIVAALDQAVKYLMLSTLTPGVAKPVIGDWFRFYLTFNSGAAFSLGTNLTWLFSSIQLAFVVGIICYSPRIKHYWPATGVALIAGGALGNLTDRLFRAPSFFFGHVVDYISVGSFAIFNLADSAITCGVIVFFIGILVDERRLADQKKVEK